MELILQIALFRVRVVKTSIMSQQLGNSINLQRDNNKPIQKKRLGVGGGSLDNSRCTALLYLDIKQHYTAGRRSQKQIQAHNEDNIKIVVFEKHMMC